MWEREHDSLGRTMTGVTLSGVQTVMKERRGEEIHKNGIREMSPKAVINFQKQSRVHSWDFVTYTASLCSTHEFAFAQCFTYTAFPVC